MEKQAGGACVRTQEEEEEVSVLNKGRGGVERDIQLEKAIHATADSYVVRSVMIHY